MTPTKEQKRIVRALRKGKNVRVTAVAGSGKTTSILGLVGCPMKILVLCYNNRLRAETDKRVTAILDDLSNDPDNIDEDRRFDVHTFHSFCFSVLHEPLASTDIGIIKIVDACSNDNIYFMSHYTDLIEKYDLIICDEAQDLNETYYKLLRLLLDNIDNSKICLIGDPRQAIYQFNGSEEKYLLEAPKYFERDFVDLCLSESFRLTKPMATFINGMYGTSEINIVSNKKSSLKPLLLHTSPDIKQIVKFIKKCNPADVLVLMYSTKRSPYKTSVQIANMLSERRVPVTFGSIESSKKTDKSVLMLSYHQSKGIERPIVILLDINKFYFEVTGEDPCKVPNLWYVAMSRASSFLMVHVDGPFTFINNGLTNIKMNVPRSDPYTEVIPKSFARKKSYDDYIRYTPSIDLWNVVQRGAKIPKLDKNINVAKMNIDQSSILGAMIIDYLRSSSHNVTKYIEDYTNNVRGGISYSIDVGSGYYMVSEPLTTINVLETCRKVMVHILNECQIDPKKIESRVTDTGSHELFDTVTDTMILVTVDHNSLDSHVRWSVAKPGDIMIDVLSGHYGRLEK